MKDVMLTAKIHCLICDTIVESTYRHDFKQCKCKSCFVDGGCDPYIRYGGDPWDFNIFGSDGKEYRWNPADQTWNLEVKNEQLQLKKSKSNRKKVRRKS